MHRTNTFTVDPRTAQTREILERVLDAAASCWNELTYARRQRLFADEDVWESESVYDDYVGVLGGAMAQTMIRPG
ncbi:hypothetical protein ACKVMT_17325 [Halobacteriales archaeon Cl-PHB]